MSRERGGSRQEEAPIFDALFSVFFLGVAAMVVGVAGILYVIAAAGVFIFACCQNGPKATWDALWSA